MRAETQMSTLTKLQMSTEFPHSKKGNKILQNAGVTYPSGCAIHRCPMWMQVHSWQPECILCLTLNVKNFSFSLFHVNEKVMSPQCIWWEFLSMDFSKKL